MPAKTAALRRALHLWKPRILAQKNFHVKGVNNYKSVYIKDNI